MIALSHDDIALAEADSALARHAGGFEKTIKLPAILIRGTADMPVTHLASDRGLVLGQVFSRGNALTHPGLTATEQQRVVETGGQSLLSSHWGHYLCITMDKAGRVSVLRDPTGGLPCYYVPAGDVLYFSSDIRLLLTLTGVRPSIDVTMLRLFLEAPSLRPERTLLSGVRELLRGHALRADGEDIVTARLWSPWAFTHGLAPEAVHHAQITSIGVKEWTLSGRSLSKTSPDCTQQ